MSRKSANTYAELWYSGKLTEAAGRFSKAKDLAAHFGLTLDALGCGLDRLRRKDAGVPKLTEIIEQHGGSKPAGDPLHKGPRHRLQPRMHIPDEIVIQGLGIPSLVVDMGNDRPTPPETPTSKKADGLPDWAHRTKDVLGELDGRSPKRTEEELDQVDEHRLKKKVRELEARNKELMDQLLNTQDALGVIKEAAEHRVAPLDMREHKSGRHEGCSLIMVSDNHLDETVSLQSTNGLNQHNPDIARSRMTRLFGGASYLTKLARQASFVRDAVVWLGGDHVSGRIHEDLNETNAMSLPESIAFAQQILADGLRYLLKDDGLEHIRVVCSPGNHSRLTPQMRVHTRIETNLETLLFLSLAREFAGEKRVSFDLPQGALTYFQVYGRTIRAFHGDLIKYGGALAGVQNPLNRAIAKWDQSIQATMNILGHFHSYLDNGRFIINGSTVGTNAYSLSIACPHERPQQAWALLDSKRFRSLSAPIFCTED